MCCALLLVSQVQKTNDSSSVVTEPNEARCAPTQNKSNDELTTMTPIPESVGDNKSSLGITDNEGVFSTGDDQPTLILSGDKHASLMIAEGDTPTIQSIKNTANSPAIQRTTTEQELPESLTPVTSGNTMDSHDGSPNSQSEEHSRDSKTILKRNIDDGMERVLEEVNFEAQFKELPEYHPEDHVQDISTIPLTPLAIVSSYRRKRNNSQGRWFSSL